MSTKFSFFFAFAFCHFNNAFSAATLPRLFSPADKAVSQSTVALLYLNGSTDAVYYQFEYADNSGLNNSIRLKSQYASSSTGYTYAKPLKMNTKYYWRARTFSKTDSSAWTSVWSFTTDTVITWRSPANNAIGLSPIISFSWDRSQNYSKYIFQIDTSNTFTTNRLLERSVTDTFSGSAVELVESSLKFKSIYYWRIKGIGATDSIRWTTAFKFTTIDTVRIYNPSSGLSSAGTNLAISWLKDPRMTYQLDLDTSPAYSSKNYNKYIIPAGHVGNFFFRDNEFDQTYYWRIRAFTPTDTCRFSKTRVFTVTGMKNKVVMSVPSTIAPNYTFSWNLVDTALVYNFQMDKSSAFNSSFLKDTLIKMDFTKNLNIQRQIFFTQLPFGTMLYLRVRPMHAKDTGDWSRVATTTVYSAPSINYPFNNNTEIPIKITHTWSSIAGITNYRIQRDISPTFNSTELVDTIGTTALPIMKYNTVYYWRMKMMHSTDTSQWSNVSKFTTVKAPTLNSPTNTKTYGPGVAGTLVWNKLDFSSQFQIQYDTNSKFNSSILLNTFVPADTLLLKMSELYFGKVYSWRVRAISSVDTSDWSAVWNFYTSNPVRLNWPSNKQTGITFGSLDWNSINGTSGYHYIMSKDTFLTNPWEGLESKDNAFFHYITPDPTEFNTKYFWKVRVFHSKDTSDWSDIWQFTTRKRNGVKLTYPAHDEQNIPLGILMTWQSVTNASYYQLEYSENPDMSNSFKPIVYLPTYQASFKPSMNYYWRVTAYNKDGAALTDPSETFHFITAQNFAAPGLISPANQAIGQSTNISLVWSSIRGATYEVEIAPEATFGTSLLSQSNTTSYSFTGLKNNQDYYWRVRAKSIFNTGIWSSVYTFKTIGSSNVNKLFLTDYSIYPNPTSNSVNIERFGDLNIESIELIDQNGSLMVYKNKLNEDIATIDVSTFSPQVYILKIITDKGTYHHKVVVQH